MYSFGRKSKEQLDTCHPDIQMILSEVIKYYDFSVLEGLRSDERQLQLFNDGKSKLNGVDIKSRHQDRGDGVSMAVDIMPYKKGTNAFSGAIADKNRFYFLMGMIRMISSQMFEEGLITHKVRFGLDWDSDDRFDDQSFNDLPHFELYTPQL